MVEPGKHARNAAIVLLLALAVWLIPGGGTAADTVGNVLTIIFLGGLAFLCFRLYMEHRETLLDLPDRARLILYTSTGLIVFTLVATSRMWDTGGALILLWFALLGIAVYGIALVVRQQREY